MTEPEYLEESSAACRAFGDRVVAWTPASIYRWAPVFRAVLATGAGDRESVVKRARRDPAAVAAIAEWQRQLLDAGLSVVAPVANAVDADGVQWVAYPFIDGVPGTGSIDEIAGAGRLLGQLHAHSAGLTPAGLPDFDWPSRTAQSAAEDADGVARVCAAELPVGEAEPVASRWRAQLDAFRTDVMPAMRDADVPWLPASLDFRALNLIFAADPAMRPTFVDFEKADRAPRILDLAVAVILFNCETTPNVGRLFDDREWDAFRDAYLGEAPPFTDEERRLWPTALRYVRLEEGMWHLVEAPEWELPGQRAYLIDLLQIDEAARFPLR